MAVVYWSILYAAVKVVFYFQKKYGSGLYLTLVRAGQLGSSASSLASAEKYQTAEDSQEGVSFESLNNQKLTPAVPIESSLNSGSDDLKLPKMPFKGDLKSKNGLYCYPQYFCNHRNLLG